ncbi:dienelactone hydrolase family protein [Coniella lustricola]|uniref:Dienelactone hydrolase family protein n=1 Tax=Coniella lustricola TaxID=2025994 RepID=A0A2T3A2Y3_9PEZI|nr:dienelactone hydrolase family protein [Coniella lustricola]
MADADIATRAPESDAQEDVQQTPTPSAPAEDQQSSTEPAKMCDDCVTDRPTPTGQGPTGEIRKLNDIDVYVSKPSEYPHTSARLLLLLTGGTGLKSTNNQIQADKFASEGYVVVMPDLFEGDEAPNSTTVDAGQAAAETTTSEGRSTSTTTGSSFLDTFKIKAAETAKSFMIDMWLARHTEEKVLPLLHKIIDGAKDEFADAVSYGGGIYAVGYCFGARYVLLLGAERKPVAAGGFLGGGSAAAKPADEEAGADAASNGPHIKAGALAHATLVSKDDFEGLKAPVSIVCVENDPLFPDEVRKHGEDYLSKSNVEHEVQVYPGVPHGFAVVGDYNDLHIKEAQATAFEQMLKWLQNH